MFIDSNAHHATEIYDLGDLIDVGRGLAIISSVEPLRPLALAFMVKLHEGGRRYPYRLLRGGVVPPGGAFGPFTLPLRAAPWSLGEPVFFAVVRPVD
jgi:hypothetical protein